MDKVNLQEQLVSLGIVDKYARLWPRDVFDTVISEPGKKKRYLAKELPILRRPGVYILYRDDLPYYIGSASNWLWHRLHSHARSPNARYGLFWNYFSVFAIDDETSRRLIESVLIAAIPTAANGSEPRLPRERLPREAVRLTRQMREQSLASGEMDAEEDE